MVYKCESDNWVISSHGCWIVGVYETERAAKYAFRFPDEELRNLWDEKCPEAITFKDLQELRKKIKKDLVNT